MYSYEPKGVCAKKINFEIVDNIITEVVFIGGCPGNALGVSSLLKGMEVKAAIEKLKGITCGDKSTSCPDQFARALEELVAKSQ